MTGSVAPSDDDMIAVPRDLIAAAAICARNHEGESGETYKSLVAYGRSPVPIMFMGHRLRDLQCGNWHPGDEA